MVTPLDLANQVVSTMFPINVLGYTRKIGQKHAGLFILITGCSSFSLIRPPPTPPHPDPDIKLHDSLNGRINSNQFMIGSSTDICIAYTCWACCDLVVWFISIDQKVFV